MMPPEVPGYPPTDQGDMGTNGGDGPVISVWRRWTDDGPVPFHEYCTIRVGNFPPRAGSNSDEDAADTEKPELSYTPPIVRWALKRTPVLVLLWLLWTIAVEFGDAIYRFLNQSVWPYFTPLAILVSLGIILWIALLAWIVERVLQSPETDAVQSILVHSLSIILTVGLLVHMYIAFPQEPVKVSNSLASAIQSIDFPFLWMLFFGGHLVYDGMLRTENMFDKLDKKEPVIVHDSEAYDHFKEELICDLEKSISLESYLPKRFREGRISIPTAIPISYLFAFVFVLPFFLIGWLFPSLPNPTSNFALRGATHLGVSMLNFFLVVVFFQFLVLVTYFNRLLSDKEGDVTLMYNPKHHDDFAGFGDFGRFATRVNILLVIGGIYIANFLYAGLRGFPGVPEGITLEFLTWGVGTFFPLLTYIFAVVLWFYLSFWQMHKKMTRGRERYLEKLAIDGDEPDEEIRNGPVWPLNNQGLISNITIDMIPLMSFLPFIRF